jgi:hypothetical protein
LGSGFLVSGFLVSGLGSGLAAGLAASSDEEEDEAGACPLHFFNASIHFLRSSALLQARERF